MTDDHAVFIEMLEKVDTDGHVTGFDIVDAAPFVTFSLSLIEAAHVNQGSATAPIVAYNEQPFFGRCWLERVPRFKFNPRAPHIAGHYLGAVLLIAGDNRTLAYELGQTYVGTSGPGKGRLLIDGHWPD